jgi:signal transduction histidine kinase
MNFSKIIINFYILLIGLFFPIYSIAQNPEKKVTFYLNGANSDFLLNQLQYWVANSEKSTSQNAESAFNSKKFKTWKTPNTLNLKKLETDLWIHLFVKNLSQKDKIYWWGIYTQSDTILVYEKIVNNWKFIEKLDYSQNIENRKSKTRFLMTELDFKQNSNKELMLQIKNKRHTTNFFSDITTPEDNLKWENTFYWEIAFFVGMFFLTFCVSLLIGFITRNKIFYFYAFYVLIVIIVTLQEEVFISIFPNFMFQIFSHLNSQTLALIGVSLHFYIANYLMKDKKTNSKFENLLQLFLNFNIFFGIITSLIYALFKNQIGFDLFIFRIIWNVITFLIIISIVTNGILIFTYFNKKNRFLIGLIVAMLFLFFNSATYYLNYSGFISLYEISHPNYFYLISIAETLTLGGFIAFIIKKTIDRNINLLKEKNQFEETISRNHIDFQKTINNTILETQEQVLQNISQDLHDDAGQQLTVINFQLENLKLDSQELDSALTPISKSVNELSKSIRSISHSLNNQLLSQQNLIKAIEIEVDRLQENKSIKINFVHDASNVQLFDTNQKIVLYRIFQETINNILKHSKASIIDINIKYNPKFEIKISDNGQGFDLQQISNSKHSLGLKNIINRAKIINFEAQIFSEIGNGTVVILSDLGKTL